MWRRILHRDPGARAVALFDKGVLLSQSGKLREAQRALVGAVKAYQRWLPDHRAEYGLPRALWRLANVEAGLGLLFKALAAGTEAIARWEELLRQPKPGQNTLEIVRELVRCCTDVSAFALSAGQRQEALRYSRRAVDLADSLIQGGHAEGRTESGTAQHNLALAYLSEGSPEEAVKAGQAAVAVREGLSASSQHPSLADWEYANSLLLLAK